MHVWQAMQTRQLIGGIRRLKDHRAQTVATNLGEVSEASATFVTTQRAEQTKGAKKDVFSVLFFARLWHLDRNTGPVIDGAVWSSLNGNQPVLTYLASRWTLINGPQKILLPWHRAELHSHGLKCTTGWLWLCWGRQPGILSISAVFYGQGFSVCTL